MTLRKFAELTGYAPSTVSKAFSESSEISEKTKAEIFAKAREFGCFDQFYKKRAKTPMVAIICPELSSEYYCNLLNCLIRAFAAKKIGTVISVTGFSPSAESEQVAYYSGAHRVDGMILIEGQSVSKKYAPIPTVCINPFHENPYADTVSTDFYSGICEAIWTFKMNGHHRVAYIGEALTEDKKDFFLRAMNTYGLPVDPALVIVSDLRSEEAGKHAMDRFYESGNLPTAVFAAYDDIALGVIRSVEDHQGSVPEDLSLVGIDNIRLAAYHRISLSSIRSNIEEIADSAAGILAEKIADPRVSLIRKISLRSTLVNRGSIGVNSAEK